jgi:1-deoxy-D-xylulose-5-phosphate synthase
MLVTVEEGAAGGFGSHVLNFLANADLLRPGLAVRTMTLPDRFQDQHENLVAQYAEAGLNAGDIAAVVSKVLLTAGQLRTA